MKNNYLLLPLLILSLPLFAQQLQPVHFSSGPEIFPENYAVVRQNPNILPEEITNGYYLRYVQCAQIPTAEAREVLENEGVRFIAYVHFGAYLTALPEKFDVEKLGQLQVRSIVPVKPEWKMARNLRETPFGDWAVHGDLLDVNLQVYPHIDLTRGAELCRRLGLTLLLEGNQNGFLQLRIPKDNLENLAALPWVQSLELVPPPGEPEDTRGRALHRSNALDNAHPMGLKYNGNGVSVLVRDDGPIGPHIDFQGRMNNLVDSGDDGTHGDGVGGILAGAGNLDPVKKGMAAAADVYAIRYTPEFQDQTLPLHLTKNITITNTSYSNGCNAGYTIAAQTVDQQIFEHPSLMHVFSAGNSNNINTCLSYGAGNQWGNITGGHKMAKNAIATANLLPDATLVLSSSRGPAYDGRLKPDISANGNEQDSTDPDNTYITFGGTSAAAPGIAGCLAQLTHAYKSLNNGEQPRSALLKAAILNTANDLGNTGPDFKFGWGHVNAWRALNLLEQHNWLEAQAEQGESNAHQVQIPAGVRQARIMLYWADPPASVNASKSLVNDLDITVEAPGGGVFRPWKLDPAPDPVILNTPAGKGRDSLNNTEQAAIDNPAPGNYTVKISGVEVPFGPQQYVIVWEFLTDEVKLTYPVGGEGFVPGEVERIHWDAFGNQGTFSLRYSLDDGFSWLQIADVAGDKRMFDWQVPEVLSGKVRLLVQRGLSTHSTAFPLSICPLPQDITIDKVCPASMTISWTPAKDTLPSDVYLLGAKHMEIVGTTTGNTFSFPIQNGGAEKWVSVRARNNNGLAGRRAVAVQWPGELKNCIQPDDLGVRDLNSPKDETAISCGPFSIPVAVQLKNEGLNAIAGAVLNYQVNGDPVVSQAIPNIAPGAMTLFTFQTPIQVTENEQIDLKVWSTYSPEDAFFNDTLRHTFLAIAQPADNYFTENFQSADFPPFGWRIGNPDGGLTWTRTAQSVTGYNDEPTRAVALYSFFYFDGIGEQDYIDLVPVDLSSIQNPGLTFRMAHAYRNNAVEQLRVEVYPACDLSAPPVVVWQKSDPELSTAGALGSSFVPNEAEDWRTEAVSLSQFAGQKVIIRFVAINDAGNNIFLDNIGIVKYDLSQPAAAFGIFTDSTCIADTVLFSAVPTGGNFTNYEWSFGITAQPSTAAGPGPHAVRFLSGGLKTVSLNVFNAAGSDTITRDVVVSGNPIANFTAQPDGVSVSFKNTSLNAHSHLWDFGDPASGPDNFSTVADPVHHYTAPGTYTVKLSVANKCKTSSKSLTFSLTTAAGEPEGQFLNVRILPNPSTGEFRAEIESAVSGTAQLRLTDASGRLIKTENVSVIQGVTTIPFKDLQLAGGTYQLYVQQDRHVQVLNLVIR